MKMSTPLTVFLRKADGDQMILATHVSLFTSIVQCWASRGRMNPVVVSRSKLMRMSKIKSTSTYHKCIKDLSRSNYINYMPSFCPSGSLIFLNK